MSEFKIKPIIIINNNNNNNIYTGGVLTLSGFRNGPVKNIIKNIKATYILHNLKKVRYLE